MRASICFGADNVISLRCYSEPKPAERGDTRAQKELELEAQRFDERGLYQRYLARMDAMGTDKLDLYDTDKFGVPDRENRSVIHRRKCLEEIQRLDLLKESRRGKKTEPNKKHTDWGKTHKPSKLTSYAKKSLREAGSLLDRYFKGNTYMTTCTLPTTNPQAWMLLANWSGYMMDRLLRQVRNVKSALSYYVWEWQQRGALHLHFVIAHPDEEIAKRLAYRVRSDWFKVLGELSDRHGIDMFSSDNAPGGSWRNRPKKWQWSVEKITKSVTGYLSKYLCKGSMGFLPGFYPGRWWGCNKELRDLYKTLRVEVKLSELPNNIARACYHFWADKLSELCPSFVCSFEHYVHEKMELVKGFDTIVETPRVIFELEGTNIYFPPEKWVDIYNDLADYFRAESNPFLHDIEFA